MAEDPANSIARLRPGALFLVATPIGNLGDLSPRGREVLRDADLLLAEDTRHTAQLLHACGLQRPPGTVESLHEHNERERVERVLERLRDGAAVALVSDAGTPLVSDPGALLVAAAAQAGVEVIAVPGPCAAIAALMVAALPATRFAFEGFLPARRAARRELLRSLARETRTLVFYEAPHRVRDSLDDIAAEFGPDRPAVAARELTKKFETVYRGTLATLAQRAATDADFERGEIVLVVQGAADAAGAASMEAAEAERILRILLEDLPASRAARAAARITGRARKELYERALQLRQGTAPSS